jgi:hypothetical protein
MTTSSQSRTPQPPGPDGNHWKELTAALPESVSVLDRWIDRQLVRLEAEHKDFTTPRSLRKSLHR